MASTIADLEDELRRLDRHHAATIQRVAEDHGKKINALTDEVESLRAQITELSSRLQQLEHG